MFDLTPYDRRHSRLTALNPFRELEDMERSFFGRNSLEAFKTDIKDVGNAFELEADLPGFKKEDIAIDINDNYLTIRAERHFENDTKDKDGQYISQERSYGSFARSFDISAVDEEHITASYENGVLKLVLPKKEQTKPSGGRRLEIN